MFATKALTVALGLLTAILQVNAKCCNRETDNYGDHICEDGKTHEGYCCGVGKCNIFCCACEDGMSTPNKIHLSHCMD